METYAFLWYNLTLVSSASHALINPGQHNGIQVFYGRFVNVNPQSIWVDREQDVP